MDIGLLCYLVEDFNAAIHTDPDVHWSHDFFNSCPRCGALNTLTLDVSYPYYGVKVQRGCNVCAYEWDTEVGGEDYYPDYSEDYLNEDDEDEFERQLSECGMTEDGFCMLAGTEHCDWDCHIDWSDDELIGFTEDDTYGDIYPLEDDYLIDHPLDPDGF